MHQQQHQQQQTLPLPQREWWLPLTTPTPQSLAEDIRKNCQEERENAKRLQSELEDMAAAAHLADQQRQQQQQQQQQQDYTRALLIYWKQALKGLPKAIARKEFTHSVYKSILMDAVTNRDRGKGHNSVSVNQIRYGPQERTMVTLRTRKTPLQLRDTKRYYLNPFYSVAYAHPLSYLLGYKEGDVLSSQGGYVRNTQHLIAPRATQVQDIRAEEDLQAEEEEEESTDDEELPYLLLQAMKENETKIPENLHAAHNSSEDKRCKKRCRPYKATDNIETEEEEDREFSKLRRKRKRKDRNNYDSSSDEIDTDEEQA